MKCVRCDRDSTYPERKDQKCPGCGGKFAFEPRTGDPLSDGAWKSAIDQVSSNGTVRFTLPHLHHAIARRMKTPASGLAVGLIVFGAIVLVVGAIAGLLGLCVGAGLTLFFGIMLAIARKGSAPGLRLNFHEFKSYYGRWVGAHGTPKQLIEPRAIDRNLSTEMRRELESYSFDRAVICDRHETVDLLLGNDFHFENNCAVLTSGGYPHHASEMIKKMIMQNPRIEVFVLHDATFEGCMLAHHLRCAPDWFAGRDVRIYDVALRPGQAEKHPNMRTNEPRSLDSHPAMTSHERSWLESHSMSLAAFTPEQTIKRLYRAMQSMPDEAITASGSDGGSGFDIMIWNSDASASDGGGDSFG